NETRLEDSRQPTISPPTTYSRTKCQLEVGEPRPGADCGMSAAPVGSLCTCEASSARSYSQCDGAAVVARRRSMDDAIVADLQKSPYQIELYSEDLEATLF